MFWIILDDMTFMDTFFRKLYYILYHYNPIFSLLSERNVHL